jgi:hypothetical protein
MTTVWAVVRDGKIVPVESFPLQEGARLLITVMPETEEDAFWEAINQDALAKVWDNEQDDVYAQLLEK